MFHIYSCGTDVKLFDVVNNDIYVIKPTNGGGKKRKKIYRINFLQHFCSTGG